MLKGFKEFISQGNALELAVAVIIGAAFKPIVDAITKVIIPSSVSSSAAPTSTPWEHSPCTIMAVTPSTWPPPRSSPRTLTAT